MATRFYIETSDEYGPTEYDAFPTVEQAMALASQLVDENGFRYATVVDRDECVELARFGQAA